MMSRQRRIGKHGRKDYAAMWKRYCAIRKAFLAFMDTSGVEGAGADQLRRAKDYRVHSGS